MGDNSKPRAIRTAFLITKVAASLGLGGEVVLVAIAIGARLVKTDGYVGTNLASDAEFFAVVFSPLLFLSALALGVVAGVGLRLEKGADRRPYTRGLLGAGVLLLLSLLAIVFGVGFLGGGIVPH